MIKNISKKEIILIFFIIGLIGSIMFCPVKMESGKTCLFHKILGDEVDQIPHQISVMEQNHRKLMQYLHPFGFIWWFSIFLLISSLYYLKNSNQRS